MSDAPIATSTPRSLQLPDEQLSLQAAEAAEILGMDTWRFHWTRLQQPVENRRHPPHQNRTDGGALHFGLILL